MTRGFEILLEDEAILAVAKPVGIATQAPPAFDSLEVRIRRYLAGAEQDPAAVYLGIPHRLDRPVSGAMLFAKTRRAARQLSRQFERRKIRKVYWACVEGWVEPAAGTWTDHLHKVYGQPRAAVVDAAHPEAQEAILQYRTLGVHRAGSWLEIELQTGRTHQVRVQASSRGFPVVGDEFYGSQLPFGAPTEDARQRPIALLARSLTFYHPEQQREITVLAAPSNDWTELQLAETSKD